MPMAGNSCTIERNMLQGYLAPRRPAALEHVPKKLLDFFHQDMLQLFDFELRPYRSNDMIPFDRDAL